MAFLRPGQFLSGVPCRLFVLFLALVNADPAIGYAAIPTNITHDGTLGTTVTPNGNVFDINGGTIKGTNQFHSFGKFSVGTGDIASFNGPTSIANILSRVTGGQQSMIDGQIRSTIAGANLYLMNPAGVLFGPRASLNLSGSFHVTTADYLRLTDNVRFLATPDVAKDGLLTTAPVAAFGFLGPRQPIFIQGSFLEVPDGKTLSVVGGDIQIEGGLNFSSDPINFQSLLKARSGRIQLASVASIGEVLVLSPEGGLTFEGNPVEALGRIHIRDGANINVTGDAGGSVIVRSGELVVDNAFVRANTFGDVDGANPGLDIHVSGKMEVTNGAELTTDLFGAGDAGEIRIRAKNIQVTRTAFIGSRADAFSTGDAGNVTLSADEFISISGGSRVGSSTFEFSTGKAGNITLSAGNFISLSGASFINSTVGEASTGNAGNITISAGDSISISESFVDSLTDEFSTGDAGNVTITAKDSITISEGSRVASASLDIGQGGVIHISGPTSEFSPTLTLDAGSILGISVLDAGDILVDVGKLVVRDGSMNSTTFLGQAGVVRVSAKESIHISASGDVRKTSGLFSESVLEGQGGDISIVTPVLTMDGGRIGTETFGDGNAGNIDINVGTLLLSDGAQIQSGTIGGRGRGGTVTVRGRDGGNSQADLVSIRGSHTFEGFSTPSGLSTDAQGEGPGGTILVQAKTLNVIDGGIISALTSSAAATAAGGSITIIADQMTVTSGASVTTASVTHLPESDLPPVTPAGNAGNIVLQVAGLTLQDGGLITSSTFGSGLGGSVTVTANDSVVSITGASHIESRTDGSGSGGTVTITAGEVSLSDPLTLISANTGATGSAGDILLDAGVVTVRAGAGITSLTSGPGNAGSVTIKAKDSVLISDRVPFFDSSMASVIASSSIRPVTDGPGGDAGRVSIETPTLRVEHAGAITTGTFSTGRGGDVLLDVGNLIVAHGGSIASGAGGSGKGGTVTIIAKDTISISGRDELGIQSSVSVASLLGSGDAGQMRIESETLSLNGGVITALTTGQGNAGAIDLSVRTMTVTGESRISGFTAGTGKGGTITIAASDSISIANSTVETGTFGKADAGHLTISAKAITLHERGSLSASTGNPLDPAAARDTGRAGDIVVNATTLDLLNGGEIESNTFNAGVGGTVIVTATDKVTVSGRDGTGFRSGITSIAAASGNAGQLVVISPVTEISDGGIISTNTGAGGDAGAISLQTGQLTIAGGARVSSSTIAAGQGGNISVQAQEIALVDGGTIVASSSTAANAGGITISVRDRFASTNGFVTTDAKLADGGDITITAPNTVHLINSEISSSVGNATKTDTIGGNITIAPSFFILQNSHIVANAFAGTGGNITLIADVFLADPSTIISASSALGISGNIIIESPVQNLSGTLSPLPSTLLTIAPLTSQCAARAQGGSFSSFTVAGRDGVPAEPGGLLPSPLAQPGLSFTADRQWRPAGDSALPLSVLVAMNWEGRCSP